MKHITSRDNPLYKQVLRLAHSSRERRKAAQTLLDGVHLIETYAAAAGAPQALIVSASGAEKPEVAQLLRRLPPQVAVSVFADTLFAEVAPVQTPVGVLALIATPKPVALPANLDSCIALEDIQDPGNLGAILRSAAAAGVRHALLSKGCAFAWAPRVVRAGMGAHFALTLYERVDLPAALRGFSGRIIAACANAGRSLFATDLRGKIALLIGNEGAGLSNELLELAHEKVHIPMPGKVESLNAAAAVAVCLFERVRQLG